MQVNANDCKFNAPTWLVKEVRYTGAKHKGWVAFHDSLKTTYRFELSETAAVWTYRLTDSASGGSTLFSVDTGTGAMRLYHIGEEPLFRSDCKYPTIALATNQPGILYAALLAYGFTRGMSYQDDIAWYNNCPLSSAESKANQAFPLLLICFQKLYDTKTIAAYQVARKHFNVTHKEGTEASSSFTDGDFMVSFSGYRPPQPSVIKPSVCCVE